MAESAASPVSRAIERDAAREGWRVWGIAIGLTLVGFLAAYRFVGPAPPDSIVLATGASDGAYHAFGQRYAAFLADYGIDVEVRVTAGAVENAELLASGEADVAFVQGGTVAEDDEADLKGIASLYYEPLWIFHRADLDVARLADLAGRRIQVGAVGSGTRAVASTLLAASGIDEGSATFFDLSSADAAELLVAGELDAAFLVVSPQSAVVARLMEPAPGRIESAVRLLDIDRHLAYVRAFPYLAHVVLPAGGFDLRRDLPDHPVDLLAPTAALLAREGLHPAVVPLFIRAAEKIHGAGSLFAAPGTFPSRENLGVPLAPSAREYFDHGRSLLYRVFPFQVAAAFDRLKILLLPLLTLLVPLLRFAPIVYRWRIRSKIYRWYGVMQKIEERFARESGREGQERCLAELAELEREIVETVKVPGSYMEELYNLRMHLARLRERVAVRPGAGSSGA